MIMFTALLGLLTSGAGGGIVGGILGIFKQSQERKERVAMAELNVKRDMLEYKNAKDERDHALVMLDKQGEIKLETIQTESEAEIEITHVKALGEAQSVFGNLKTSSKMDDFRASVRPVLAYWAITIFSVMLVWAFAEFAGQLTAAEGMKILIQLISTLLFTVSSITAFYYVSRRNSAPSK
jgi:hypothetical protein